MTPSELEEIENRARRSVDPRPPHNRYVTDEGITVVRESVPALIAEVRRQSAEIERLKAVVAEALDDYENYFGPGNDSEKVGRWREALR